jgi:hypothetical protein
MLAVMQWQRDRDWAQFAGKMRTGGSIMSDKNRDIAEHLKADVWEKHLHDIDLMNRAADENTARYLARFKEDTRREKALFKEAQQGQLNAELARVRFWITEK